MRLADADVLPFEFTATARTLHEYVDQIEKMVTDMPQAPAIDFGPLQKSLEHLDRAAAAYNDAARSGRIAKLSTSQLADLNKILYTSERAFRYDAGLPRRPWFKHLAYAPGFYTGYGVKTLPGIREGVEQKHWDEARDFVGIVAKAVDKLADDVDHARGIIAGQ